MIHTLPRLLWMKNPRTGPWRERNPGKKPKCAFHVQLYINMPLEFVKIALLTEVLDRFNPNYTENTEKSHKISENFQSKMAHLKV